MTDKRADITPAALAYLGDSVIEVLARERLVSAGIPDSARLNLAAAKYVRATVQSDAVERILPLLDEAEAASRAATPRRITYDVSAHDADRGCAVAYCMGTGPEEGRWLKVYMQVTPGLLSYLNMICRDKVHIYVEGE